MGDVSALRQAAVDVRAKPPIRSDVDRVRLIAGNTGPGSWRTLVEFPLAAA